MPKSELEIKIDTFVDCWGLSGNKDFNGGLKIDLIKIMTEACKQQRQIDEDWSIVAAIHEAPFPEALR